MQRIFQIAAYKTKREFVSGTPLSAPELAAEYNKKVAVSSGEAVTKDWTYSALAVYDKILKDDVCRALVLSVPHQNCMCSCMLCVTCRPQCAVRRASCVVCVCVCARVCACVRPQAEEEFGKKTPWDSATKLEWVYKKAKSTDTRRRIIWLLSAVSDLVRSKTVAPGELSIAGMSGKLRGGRGMLDLLLFKLDLLDELLVASADKVGLSADSKNKLRAIFESHASYRAHFGDNLDMTWMSTLPQSTKLFIAIVEDHQYMHVCVRD